MPLGDSVNMLPISMRSPLLLSPAESFVLVVDMQEKLVPHIEKSERVIHSILQILKGADVLAIPKVGTEQYPEKLGETIVPLQSLVPSRLPKRMFSCRELFAEDCFQRGREKMNVVLVGIESHVCILQTALDLLAAGWNVTVPVDAVGSQSQLDHEVALRRMEWSGVTLTTASSILFEWTESSLHPHFKEISKIVKWKMGDPL